MQKGLVQVALEQGKKNNSNGCAEDGICYSDSFARIGPHTRGKRSMETAQNICGFFFFQHKRLIKTKVGEEK